MMEARIGGDERCSFCKTPVREDYLVCPTCGRRLQEQLPVVPQAHRPAVAGVPVLRGRRPRDAAGLRPRLTPICRGGAGHAAGAAP